MKTKQQLIKQLHTVYGKYGINKERKEAIYCGYGVESSTELSCDQIQDIINKLNTNLGNNTDPDMDIWRKRVLAVMFKFYGKVDINYIKSIACRATKTENFNKITKSKLRAIYNEFLNKNKVKKIVKTEIDMYKNMIVIAPIGNC